MLITPDSIILTTFWEANDSLDFNYFLNAVYTINYIFCYFI